MNEPRRILVKCTYVIPVEFPENWTDDMIRLEMRTKCPGTGFVGAAFDDHYQKQKAESMCWVCTLDAEMMAAGIPLAEMEIVHGLAPSTQS